MGFSVGWHYYPNFSQMILKTTDGGTNWFSLNSGTTLALYSVYFPDADTGYAVGYGGIILKTNNGGISWTSKHTGYTVNDLNSVFFTDAHTGYTVGEGGTILKTTDGGGFPVVVNNIPPNPSLLKIYPNPAYTIITIETQVISVKSQFTVLNVNGQQLITRQITESKTQLDISHLPKGVYYVRLTGERTVQVGKFVKQ